MAINKAQAEAELIDLLEGAIEKVKHIRLDHVEEVSKMFEDAYNYLEANVVLDDATHDTAESLVKKAQIDPTNKKQQVPNRYIPKKGINQNFAMLRNVTSDYSSPSLGKRSLFSGGGPRGQSSRSQSSRAGSSLAGSNLVGRSAKIIDDDSSDEDIPKRGIGISIGGGSNTEADAQFMAKPLKNKLLGGSNFTRDTSSPSLGKRSLGSKKPATQSSRSGLGLGKRSTFANENDTDSSAATTMASHLQAQASASASPAAMKSSRNLVSLATTTEVTQEKTPKPEYLRRLDSPSSNHAKLRKAREELTQLMRKCLKLVPKMDIDKYETIKSKFELAVQKLEEGQIVKRRPE